MLQLEKALKVLANRRRLAMLHYLQKHPGSSVKDIAGSLHYSYKATSKHLAKLRSVDFVTCEQSRFEMKYWYTAIPSALLTFVMKQ